jgi:RNA polymerase sigma-70 factor (ECF subfamily)
LLTDDELLERVRRRDPSGVEALFRRYHAPLCDFVATLLPSHAAAEDVVQDLFYVMWTESSRWRIHTTVRAYLFAAARNRALKQLRHATTVRRVVEANWGADSDDAPGMSAPPLPPDVDLESAEAKRRLRDAIDALPERTRLAMTLRWHQEMSHAEIAEAMDISLKGVEKALSSGMVKLRAAMGPR